MEIFFILLLFVLCILALWYSKQLGDSAQSSHQAASPPIDNDALIEAYSALRKFYEKGARSLPKQALHLKKLEKMVQEDLQSSPLHRCVYDYARAKLMQETEQTETV